MLAIRELFLECLLGLSSGGPFVITDII